MQSRVRTYDRAGRGSGAIRRIANLASSGCLALVALAVSVGLGLAPVMAGPAFAAGDNGAVGGTGAAIAESGEPSEDTATEPVAEQRSSTPNVIKEIGGVIGNTELSSEEELDAIRSGWGTWRTADGPGSVLAQ